MRSIGFHLFLLLVLYTVYDDDVVEKKVQEYNWKTYVFDDKNKKETKT